MRGLKVAIVVMGVLLVIGSAVLVAALARRAVVAGGPATRLVLDEPAGTRISTITTMADRIVLHLQGGGPDRMVLLDARAQLVGRVELSR